jgi:adhesin transport system membrane fusion protein
MNTPAPAAKQLEPKLVESADVDFMSDARAAIAGESRPYASAVLYLTAAVFIVLLVWAAFADLEEVAVGTGRVIPSSQVQVVQNLEGGILVQLSVVEGQTVEKDQVLLRMDDTRFTSSYREGQVKRLALMAMSARLSAEARGVGALAFPAELVKEAPNLVKSETVLFNSRRHALGQVVAGLRRSHELATRELQMSEPLVASGSISEVEVLRLRRQVNELQTNIDDRTNKFRADANEELAKVNTEIAGLDESAVAAQDRVKRTLVRSPLRGIVKKVNITTIGAVIQPGASILEIVPVDDTLLIEAQVRPEDIAFIHSGQPARVKVSAYDYTIYGGLPGKVEHVSADSIPDDKKGTTFYKVLVRTESAHLKHQGKSLAIIPGMTASVDILTGRKTVLDYLLKPVIKARERALRER